MAVAFDAAVASGDLRFIDSPSWSHTCSGTDRALYVIICGRDIGKNLSGVTVTYNSVSMTKLGGNEGVSAKSTLIFEMVNPPSGAHNVVVSGIPAFFNFIGGGSISYNGVHQSDPTPDAVVNAVDAQTVDVPNLVSGDIALSAFFDGDNDDPNPTVGTKRFSQVMFFSYRGIGADRDGSGTVTCAYTGVAFCSISAVRIQASDQGPMGGGLAAQSSVISGTVVNRIIATGGLSSQNALISGQYNRLRVTAPVVAQASTISGTVSLAGRLQGVLSTAAAQIAGVVSPRATFSGGLISQQSAIVGLFEPDYIHLYATLRSQASGISGHVDVVRMRPTPQTVTRPQHRGYKRPFAIYIDEK